MKEKEKEIAKQFADRIVEMVKRNNDEILEILNDYVEVKKSLEDKQPSFYERLDAYDNIVIAMIENMLRIRGATRTKVIQKKMAEKEKEE